MLLGKAAALNYVTCMSLQNARIAGSGYGVHQAQDPLSLMQFERRAVGDFDVLINIEYCGVCHSDIHTARNEWKNTIYPCVPGHEIVGKVAALGSKVVDLTVGETVGVGCMVESCKCCSSCEQGLEQYCQKGGPVWTYNSKEPYIGGVTYGGYSNNIVVRRDFVLRISPKLDLAAAAPLLCAGITTYSPLRHWKVGAHSKVAVVGLGGLGHMGVKLAKAMGAEVSVLTTSKNKMEDALRLGADEAVLSTDDEAMRRKQGYYDFILDTVSAQYDMNRILGLLKLNGSMVKVGVPEDAMPIAAFALIAGRRSLSGSLIGGIAETQEMLDFCAAHDIVSDIELIDIDYINTAYERMLKGDVKYRFVINMASLPCNKA